MRARTGPEHVARARLNKAFEIGGVTIAPGERAVVDLPIARLYTHTDLTMPIEIINSRRAGPRLFVCAAIHGDELNGVEIIRRLLRHSALKRLNGTLVAVPVVNVHGLLHRSRYLPDRRDLNRSFPGSGKGSLASRIADLFMHEIVAKCSHGIDLHTGAVYRENLPQVRANLDDEETLRLAQAFGTPVLINADLRDGSLREAADKFGIPMLLYESGEALRFDDVSIRTGLRGVINVMRALKMLPAVRSRKHRVEPVIARGSSWVRAPESGIISSNIALGARVSDGDSLGTITAPLSDLKSRVEAPYDGILIGRTHLPLVHEGEALFHIARFKRVSEAEQQVAALQESLEPSLHNSIEP
jgi:predicted deacylase